MKKIIAYISVLILLACNVFAQNITEGYNLYSNVFVNSVYFGYSTFIGIILIFLSLLTITRNVNEWKILFFPVTVSFMLIGIDIFIGVLIVSVILFVIESLSLKSLGEVTTVYKDLASGQRQTTRKIKTKHFTFTKQSVKDLIDEAKNK